MSWFGPKNKKEEEEEEKSYSGNYSLNIDERTGVVYSSGSKDDLRQTGSDYSKDDEEEDEKPTKKGWW